MLVSWNFLFLPHSFLLLEVQKHIFCLLILIFYILHILIFRNSEKPKWNKILQTINLMTVLPVGPLAAISVTFLIWSDG